MKHPKHPRITPMRALDLLEALIKAGATPDRWLLDRIKQELRHHVQAELTRGRSKRKSGAS